MRLKILLLMSFTVAIISIPPDWYPRGLLRFIDKQIGAPAYNAPASSLKQKPIPPAIKCPEDVSRWRGEHNIAGLTIDASPGCKVDNPFRIAALVKGTNNVDEHLLMQSGLTRDAVEKGRDLDGDGDPDEIHIRLEVVELNGSSPDTDKDVLYYEIAPGINPGLWVFAPKFVGMASESFESLSARPELRLPSPAIRVEQGDTVFVTLENTHYMPHTIHFHGVDHSFVDAQGEGNDGVPIASEKPVMPTSARTYELTPRHAGTMFYHCHVQPQVHVMMGLQGLFIVEENRPDNWLQTLNIGAGHVRYPSQAISERYDQEYDLHYLDMDAQLNHRIKQQDDPRIVTQLMHRDYDITDATMDYFLLNGKSFPYTFQESLVAVKPDTKTKLRVVNGGSEGIALHTHGHKVTVTHEDGVALTTAQQSTRDVVWIAGAQRADIELNTVDDGLHSYGEGIWLMHDHQQKAITTDGIAPGGHISAIVYERYLDPSGWPNTQGVKWDKFFDAAYYQRSIPVWESYAQHGKFSGVSSQALPIWRVIVFSMAFGVFLAMLFYSLTRRFVRGVNDR